MYFAGVFRQERKSNWEQGYPARMFLFGVVFIRGGNLCVCLKSILNFFAASSYL